MKYYYSIGNTTGLYYETGLLCRLFFFAVNPIIPNSTNYTPYGPAQIKANHFINNIRNKFLDFDNFLKKIFMNGK